MSSNNPPLFVDEYAMQCDLFAKIQTFINNMILCNKPGGDKPSGSKLFVLDPEWTLGQTTTKLNNVYKDTSCVKIAQSVWWNSQNKKR